MDSLNFDPGTDYLYTNYSPFLLAQIIENVSGEKYEYFVNKNILQPQKMSNSVFFQEFPFEKDDPIARPLNSDLKESFPPFRIESNRFLFASTVKDLFSLSQDLHQYTIINKESLKKIASKPSLSVEDPETPLGKVQIKNDQVAEHIHHGSSGNYESLLYFKNGLTIILMTNRKNSNLFELSEKIEKTFWSS